MDLATLILLSSQHLMVKSDSLIEEDMHKLELSLDFIDSKNIKKRLRVLDSEDEAIDLLTKKRSDSISQRKMLKKNIEAVTEKTDGENNHVQNKSLKQENGNKSFMNKDNCIIDTTIKIKKEKNTENKNQTVDTEVVEGLELSIECASEKEELNSESENENDIKPWTKTIIIKAEPNKSELECSSEEESFFSQDATNTLQTGKRKKGSSQTNSSKLKFNESDDSQDNNSREDYSLQTKRTNKLLTLKKSPKYSVILKKRQSKDVQRKKSNKHIFDDENLEAIEEVKKEIKIKNETEEKLLKKKSSISKTDSTISKTESINNSVDEDMSVKHKKKKYNNIRSEDISKIQKLKKYLKVAGIRVKNYNDLWADCNTNFARIICLKKLLEDNGVIGRPTLEKCKLVRQKRERIKEVSELDTSNIISEDRITRTQRNMTNNKKMSSNTDTSTLHQETRNIFKRIRIVVDSDSE